MRRRPEELFDLVVELRLAARGVDLPERAEAADLRGARGRACGIEAGVGPHDGLVGHGWSHDLGIVCLAENGEKRVALGRLPMRGLCGLVCEGL